MQIPKLAGAFALALVLPACATVTRGTSQAYVIETDPPGALATLSNGMTCTTPCALKLKRKHGFNVKLTRDGYEPVEATVVSGISGGGGAAMAGNVVLGGLIGAVVDGSSGAMNNLKPNPLTIRMVALPAAPAMATAPAPATTTAAASTAVTAPVQPAVATTPGSALATQDAIAAPVGQQAPADPVGAAETAAKDEDD
jgi:hypothetical protein